MTEMPTAARTLAQQILLHEAGGSGEPAVLAEAAERVEARLRRRLAGSIGLLGYTTLVARALHLAQGEIPALKVAAVNVEEGGLEGLREFVEGTTSSKEPQAAEAGLTAILAHIMGLLSMFIGEDLALRLVREGWPELDHDRTALEEQE